MVNRGGAVRARFPLFYYSRISSRAAKILDASRYGRVEIFVLVLSEAVLVLVIENRAGWVRLRLRARIGLRAEPALRHSKGGWNTFFNGRLSAKLRAPNHNSFGS